MVYEGPMKGRLDANQIPSESAIRIQSKPGKMAWKKAEERPKEKPKEKARIL
jgi:hypothetical protein